MTPFDIGQVLSDLGPRTDDVREAPTWLRRSYEDSPGFVRDLFQHVISRTERMAKSQPLVRYDLYHDLVVANTGLELDALQIQNGGSFETVSYDELHSRCSALASEWQERGLAEGVAICIALPFGVDYVVGLLTAIRMGVVVTLVPGLDTRLLFDRVANSGAAFVVADALDIADQLDLEVLPPRAGTRGATHTLSHVYSTGDVVAQLFSPFADDHTALAPVTADELYIGALRDGALVFRLGPGEQFAAPGFEPLQYQPQLLLAALHSGATWVEFSPEMPATGMQGVAPRVLGISPELLAAEGSLTDELLSSVRLWFRSATEALDLDEWAPVERRLAAAGVPGMSIATSAPFSGCFACSVKSVRQNALELFPIMGEPWELLDAGGGGQPALGPMGLLGNASRASAELALGQYAFTKQTGRYTFSGTLAWARSGRAFPVAALETWVTEIPAVDHAVLYLAPGVRLNDCLAVLVVFMDPLLAEDPGERSRLEKHVEEALLVFFGASSWLDQVHFYSTVPQLEDGAINREWCLERFRSGVLASKQADPIFRNLARLNRVFTMLSGDEEN